MPRRTSSRRRTGTANSAAAASNGDDGNGLVGGSPSIPSSPVKRKTRSPVPEDPQMERLKAPAAVRCTSFQSPKKKALSGGNGDRFNGPFDKENDLFLNKNCSGHQAPSEQSGSGASSLQFSAFSAFSQRAPQSTRRRGREGPSVSPPISSSPSLPAPASLAEGSALPLLLTPMTDSPDVRRMRASRRTKRSSSRLSKGHESSTSSTSNSSSSNSSNRGDGKGRGNRSSPSRALAPAPISTPGRDLLAIPRRSSRSRSGAGCAAAGGRRAATTMAMTSAPSANSSGGGPAESCQGTAGEAQPRGVGGGGSETVAPGTSPHRSPIHRLTESLQKWDPGSRLCSASSTLEEGASRDGVDDCATGDGSPCGRRMDITSGGGSTRGVGASWSGQELRRTLEGEGLMQGLGRRRSTTSAEAVHPQGRFGDHSPISPASSVASVALAGFDAGTPVSVGRPWRSSPRRAEGSVSGGSVARSVEEFGVVRMEESWSDDEADSPGVAMKLAFSPRIISGASRKISGAIPPSKSTVSSLTPAGVRTEVAPTPSIARWQHPQSPAKDGQTRVKNAGGKQILSTNSSVSSRGRRSGLATERDFSASPEPRSIHSVRDMMDHGTDDEKDGGDKAGLIPGRRRRSLLKLELKTLDTTGATDVAMGEAGAGSAPSNTTESAFSALRKFAPLPYDGRTSFPNESPLFTRQQIAGEGPDCGSASTTACPGWEGPVDESSSVPDTHAARSKGHSWSHCTSKAKNSESAQTSTGFGFGMGNEEGEEEDVGDGLAIENSGIALGISGLSGTDTSGVSDVSASFVRSRPIPDQSAFSSSRLGKSTFGQLSPSGSGGSSGSSLTAVGPTPMCLTPRKSMMRCPPTPQRTPTWDGLEDSLLLEGPGSGDGIGSTVMSTRHSLRRSKFLAGSNCSRGGGSGTAAGDGLAIGTGLANASGASRAATFLELEVRDGNRASRGRADVAAERGRGMKGPPSRSLSAKRGHGSKTLRSGEHPDQALAGVASSSRAAAAGDGALGFKQDFVQMGPIGEGGFSVVWKVRARRTGRLYAIKRSKREFRGRRDRDRCLLEARALKRLGEHPGVLRFERAWQEEGHFCLQTELCELGTLKDFLERLPSRKEIPEAAIWQVMQDVGQALRHVHVTGLVHLDVKPANLLIGDEGGRLKLADFGMATTYGDGIETVGDGQEGDTLYMAKELLSSTERLPSADIFSLGLTVFEVATRAELPGDGDDWHAMRDGRAIGLPASRSKELGAVLRQLMNPDPKRRPTADELCKHPRVADVLGGGRSGSTVARDDYVVSQARAWKAAEAAAMDHPSNGLRTPTGDMSVRYIFQQNC